MQTMNFAIEKPEYNYSDYTTENNLTWQKLFNRQVSKLKGKACQEFMNGLEQLNPLFQSLPNLEIFSENLYKLVGWRLYPTVGIIESKHFFELLANKHFPVSILIRDLDQLDFVPYADMWHDVFGHLPFLVNLVYEDFVTFLSKMWMRGNEEQKKQLSALYWYTIEAGVCQENGERRLYGTSQLSSYTEIDYALSNQPTVFPFDFQNVINTKVNVEEIQTTLFEIPSLEYLQVIKSQIDDFMCEYQETTPRITNINEKLKKSTFVDDFVAA